MSDPQQPQYQVPQANYQAPQTHPQPYAQPQYVQMVAPPSNGMATAAMVLGIITCVCFATIIGWVLVPIIGLLAIIFGFIGLSKADSLHGLGRGKAVAGLIMGFAPVAFAIIAWIVGSLAG